MADGVWRGRITRITNGRVWAEVPRLIRHAELGPLPVLVDAGAGRELAVGDGILVGPVEGRPDDLIVLGRTEGVAVNPPTEPPPGTITPAMLHPSSYADTVVPEVTFGQPAAVGTSGQLAREDHTHGTPPPPAAGGADEALLWMTVGP